MKYFIVALIFYCSSISYGNIYLENSKISSVWIFCGHPGDASGSTKFLSKIKSVKTNLKTQFGFKERNIHVYFNKGENSFSSASRENLLKAINQINKSAKKGNNCLVIFLGHANSTPKDIHYNLSGKDLSIKALSDRLQSKNEKGKIGIIWSVESGERAVRLLKNKNLIILASSETEDRDNEPVLNEFIDTLFNKKIVDANKDGRVTFLEMHTVAKRKIQKWYKDKGLIQLEKIILDGDGNGIGTSAPSSKDTVASKKLTL